MNFIKFEQPVAQLGQARKSDKAANNKIINAF